THYQSCRSYRPGSPGPDSKQSPPSAQPRETASYLEIAPPAARLLRFFPFTSSRDTSFALFRLCCRHPFFLQSVPRPERCEMKQPPKRRLGLSPGDARHLVEWKSSAVPAAPPDY